MLVAHSVFLLGEKNTAISVDHLFQKIALIIRNRLLGVFVPDEENISENLD